MSAGFLEMAGVMVATSGAAAALLLANPRARYLAMGVGLAGAVALLAGQVLDEDRFQDFTSQPAALVLAALLGGIALGATAATFRRVPVAFAIAAFAVLPLRVPVQVGGETNFLLVPLYGVIAGGFLRGVWICLRTDQSELRTASAPGAEAPLVRALAWALAASLVLYGVAVAWSEDPQNAIRTVAFFLVPFAVLLALLRDIRWYRKLVGQVLVATVLVALGFAALALYQHLMRDLLLNKDLKDANELHLYFRVNALFRDPNVLGRYLAFAIIGVAAWAAWRRPNLHVAAAGAVAAALTLALFLTYSQTSFAAVIAGLGMLVWFRLGRRGLAGAVALGIAGFAALALAGGPSRDATVDKDRTDLAETSSGRASLIDGGIDLWRDEPLIGQGSGAFATQFRFLVDKTKRPVSHTEPVTVAAEQGVVGLIPYAAVVLLSLAVFLRPWPSATVIGAGVAACYVALLVHTLGYAGFLIDPATWALLALGMTQRE